jgi:hypothetical protein
MAQRREPPDALDFFPTPPWATRALFRYVLPALGVEAVRQVWEPACGGGHMAAVISEFSDVPVIATDIFDYGYGTAPVDFLDHLASPFTDCADWIVTNPPFKPADQFALRALDLANMGVALLLRTQWLETRIGTIRSSGTVRRRCSRRLSSACRCSAGAGSPTLRRPPPIRGSSGCAVQCRERRSGFLRDVGRR